MLQREAADLTVTTSFPPVGSPVSSTGTLQRPGRGEHPIDLSRHHAGVHQPGQPRQVGGSVNCAIILTPGTSLVRPPKNADAVAPDSYTQVSRLVRAGTADAAAEVTRCTSAGETVGWIKPGIVAMSSSRGRNRTEADPKLLAPRLLEIYETCSLSRSFALRR
jgi:hypothetical protein